MLWLKALHIIFVVCWFAGIFYLPRIMVYYAASEHRETRQQLAVMARKLYRFITPLAGLAIAFGVAMMWSNLSYYLGAPWMWAKLVAVSLLLIYHIVCGRFVRAMLEGQEEHSHVYFRVFNEVPVLMLFAIVILVVLKPF